MRGDDAIRRLVEAKRILVLGSSGAGKTRLARELAPLLGLETIHLDAHFWQPGWVPSSEAQWRSTLSELVRRPSWIMDGMYERSLEARLPWADAVIVLECNPLRCLWRVVKRKLTLDDQRRPDAPPGQKVDRAFLSYVWRYPRATRPLVQRCLADCGPDKCVIVLKGGREKRRFLESVERLTRQRDRTSSGVAAK